jgi:molecular chaperone IbpA
MNRLTTLDLNKLTPHALGFDSLFDGLLRQVEHAPQQGFPPYNIRQDENKFQIEMALAGVELDDLDIETAEGVLTIVHDPKSDSDEETMLHRGIAIRKFKRSFTLADDVLVKGARMKNGMLFIELEKIIPEEKMPKKIAISSS